ncbi:MAG: hypothetical protein LBS64_03205 [Spirochaetaceae bacterium]|nr:hypothetical protein [Spirochaetaceae bacterium]
MDIKDGREFYMRKIFFAGLLISAISFSVSAHGVYFDIGVGGGGAKTKVDGIDMGNLLDSSGIKETAFDLGVKAGYGPIAHRPLYIVAEFAGMGHRFEDAKDYIQYTSYAIGPGIIFYPTSLIQLAGSVGLSFTGNHTSLGTMYNGDGGFAWNISAAADLGRGKHGCLLGLRYFSATNTLASNAKQKSSAFSVFVKYAFRQKLQKA